jgi:group I intron endonuclease
MIGGVYCISSPSGGKYIGSAIRFSDRWRVHRHHLQKGDHHNPGLQRAAAKYGLKNLKFSKLIICRPEDVLMFEQIAINALTPKYNAAPIAGSMLGFKHSVESNEKNAAKHRGRRQTLEQKKHRSRSMMGNTIMVGRKLKPETRTRISISLKNKLHSDGFEMSVTEAQKADIVGSYLAGNGQVALSKKWKTSHKVIRRILVAAGIEISPSGHAIKKLGS